MAACECDDCGFDEFGCSTLSLVKGTTGDCLDVDRNG